MQQKLMMLKTREFSTVGFEIRLRSDQIRYKILEYSTRKKRATAKF